MKKRYRSAILPGAGGRIFPFLLVLCLLLPAAAVAGHRLSDKQCYDCHVVGGALADVVTGSHLIRKTDSRMSQILANGWTPGTPVPCVYCHDTYGRGVRSNMIGVWNDFTTPTSKHPVDPYNSNWDAAKEGGDQTTLDCIDCHDMNVVYYVKGGTASGTTLSPNIHERDVSSVVSTPGPGLLTAADTWKNWSTAGTVSPYNTGGNTFCTRQCHDTLPGTGVDANRAAHGYTSPLVTLELPSGLDTTVNGCLDEGAGVGGCHSAHKASDNPDLITQKNAVGTTIRRTDCGACHVFDDPPTSRGTSDWYSNGHGRFSTTNGITCLSCHDSAIPHFGADGSANASSPNRLAFAVDSIPSGFSSPAKSRLSICTTCHAGYTAHTSVASPYNPVGCLDCHDPHGYGVGPNIKMMRRQAPISSPTVTLSYANSGDWYDSSVTTPGIYSNWVCDSADCHPHSISAIMDTSVGNTVPHAGGTGIKSGCDNCHKHTGGEYSWAATGCDQCHGGAGSYWPAAAGSDDGGATPNDAGRHGIHRQKLEARLGYASGTTNDGEQKTMCRYCHKVGDSDHTSSTRAEVFPAGYAKAIWDTPSQAPSETNASFTAGTNAGTCTNVDCHNNKQTAVGYRWYESSTSTCTMCHTVGTGNPGAFIDPQSGLHDEVPKVSGVQHDDSFAYGASTAGCATCHTATPSVSHIDGTDDSSIAATGNTAINFSADVNFSDSTLPPTCAPTGGLSGCHLEQSVGESWRRLWHENSDGGGGAGSECAGCHGDFTLGWNNGVMHAGSPLRGNTMHVNTGTLTYQCTDCHGIGANSGNYAFASTANDWDQNTGETSDHGNASITMNVNSTSWGRSGGRSGCSGCHEGATGTANAHDFPQTSWPAATIQGDVPPTGCDSCHGGTGLYYPQTASVQTTDYPDRAGQHSVHISALEAKIGYSAGTTNDAEQKHMCEYCHNDPLGVGGAGHNDDVIPANVGSFNGIWSTSNPPGAADGGDPGIITGSKTCQDVDCHYDGTGTDTTPDDWYTGGTADCSYCHGYETTYPTGSLPDYHDMHVDEAGSGGYDYICAVCHSGSTSYTNWHASGSAANDVSFSALATTAGFTSPVYDTTQKTCDNVYCHGQSALPDWNGGAGQSACGTCHGDSSGKPDTPLSGGSHTSSTHSAQAAVSCITCHENDNTDRTKHVHGPADALGVALVSAAGSSITAYSYGAHLGTDTDGYKYSAGTCQTDGCHASATWGGTGGCTFCHGSDVTGYYYPQTASAGTVDYPDRAGEHAAHFPAIAAKIGYSQTTTNDAEQKHICEYCHNDSNGVGGSNHNDNTAPADVGSFNPIWDTANPPTTADAGAVINGDKTCSGIDCHYNRTTPDSWYGARSSDCTLCHFDGTDDGTLLHAHPGSGRHATHVASNTYVPNDCATCHGANANNPPLGDAAHRNGQASFGNSLSSYTAPGCVNACHDVIPASYGDWLDANPLDCLNCHSGAYIGGGAYAPASGLHTITPTVSGVRHAEALSPTSRCEVCHTTIAAGQATHINGTWQADNGANTESRGLFTDYTDGTPGTCSGSPGTVGAAGCHDGQGEQGSWARRWSTTAANSDGTECANCHGGFDGQAWTFGTGAHNTSDGSVEHGYDWNTSGGAQVIGNHADTATQGTTCNICHVYADSPYNSTAWANTWHGNGLIDMNDSMGYNSATWDCSNNCHAGGTPIAMEDSGWNINPVTGPALSCTSCHGASNPSAGVGTLSSHLATIKGGGNASCEACHPGGLRGAQHSKNADTNVVVIPNYSAVGITYSHQPDGSTYGFVLGGDATAGTTEAQICWGCHDQNGDGDLNDANDISEWGTNINAVTGSISYNYGSLDRADWTTAIWTSPNFAYKTSTVRSTHTANPASLGGPTGPGLDSVGQIRCSYCHDVHNTARNRSAVITTTMDPDGKPYLRGRWKGNPYNEDGAPQSGTTYTDNGSYDQVPRATMTSTDLGGYYIDQNTSNDPVERSWTADSMAGLCEYCHGNGDGTWTATEIDSLNVFGVSSSDWVGTNGHANAVLGGTGSTSANAANIYRESDRKPTDGFLGSGGTDLDGNKSGTDGYGAGMPDMGNSQLDFKGDRGFGFRSNPGDKVGWDVSPTLLASKPFGYKDFNSSGVGWGTVLTVDNTTTDNKFHQFSCSKCHNPHASRLPRLMITNCLDTVHNTWDDTRTIPVKGTVNRDGSAHIWDDNNNVELGETTSAQNCHRRGHSANGTGSGWNLVTPWQ